MVLGLALAYGGIGQFAAGMWEFVKGNTFGALAFASYGGFWISFWWLLNHIPADAKGNDLNHGIGVYLLAWAIFTAYMFIGSTRISGAVAAVFLFLTLTFLFLALGKLTQSATEYRFDRSLQIRWLARHRHRGARLVRVLRGGHKLHVQADRPADLPPLRSMPHE